MEEGFLDGLDVSFVPGLNVIIGARGTGKTSLIELIRFCLNVPGVTSESRKGSLDHARSVLGSGQVTVTLSEGERDLLVTRTADEDVPRASGTFVAPIVFSQTEIETVGLRAQGRLALLDGFFDATEDTGAREPAARSEVRSLTAELASKRREIDELVGLVAQLPDLEEKLVGLAAEEAKVAKASTSAGKKKDQLDLLSSEIARAAVRSDAISRFHKDVSAWLSSVSASLSARPALEAVGRGPDDDPLAGCRASFDRAQEHLKGAVRELQRAVEQSEAHLLSTQESKIEIESRARELRQEVEALRKGAGSVVRQGQKLRERKAQLESLVGVLTERRNALQEPFSSRDTALETLDSIRRERFEKRRAVAKDLTRTLRPRLRVEVSRQGQFEAFGAAIADALRGSGLRYNELSRTLARSVSPRELLEAVEMGDHELIAEAAEISADRAARAIGHLRDCDLGALATVDVEDTVALELLDGGEYKGVRELSTGQRCTAVLPLVLQHTERALIIDQPEDHIDNAFIADTLIVSLLARARVAQTIVSTHNANVPVLGDAARVVQLGSDGRRGFVLLASSLDDPRVVSAITTVMEGGAEAFRKRATFYGRYEGE